MIKPDLPVLHSLDRRSFVSGLGGGVALAISSIAAANAGNASSPLYSLIDAHKMARAAWRGAHDRLEELEDAYEAAFPRNKIPLVPSLVRKGSSYDLERGLGGCIENISGEYRRRHEGLKQFSQIDPEFVAQVSAKLDAMEAENMALAVRAWGKEEAQKEKFGLAAAEHAMSATNDADEKAFIAVCAYPCESLDEARIKAEYLASIPLDMMGKEHLEALVQSFLPQVHEETL